MKAFSPPRSLGSTLAVVMITMAVLMVTVGIAFEYTTNVNRTAQRSAAYQRALTVGDDAIEVLFYAWRATCRNPPTPPVPRTSDLTSLATPSPFPNITPTNFVKRGTSRDPNSDSDYASGFTISNYKVIAVSAEYGVLPTATSTPEPQLGQVGGDISSVSPTTSAVYNYVASADVTLPTSFGAVANRKVVARVRRVFSKQQLSPWNWAIFYADPLEIHPGPQFTVTGWVHTNANLYTGHSTLTFADKVTYTGDWFYPNQTNPGYGFMPGDGKHPETPTAPNWPSNLPPARDQEQQPFGLDSSQVFDTTDSDPNNDGYHELIEPPTNLGTYPDNKLVNDQGTPVRYYDQASVIITVDNSNNVTIGQGNGAGGFTNIAPPTSGPDPRTAAQKDLYNMFGTAGVITTGGSIQDNREGTPNVRTVTLDVSKLTASGSVPNGVKWALSNQSNFNGIVYIHDSSATTNLNPDGSINSSPVRRGIEVVNGSQIPIGGITVASANPVYLQGDFNTGRGIDADNDGAPDNGVETPSNVPNSYTDPANPPDPMVSGYTRAPCAVIADAVNILSNSWKDGVSTSSTAALPTTVNTAIVSGIVPTNTYGDNAYSGGAENFPRFHENWSGKTLTYYGSMVELYKSQQAIGEWGKANVYSPPTREWFFDSGFKTRPPLGTIMIYTYTKGKWSVL